MRLLIFLVSIFVLVACASKSQDAVISIYPSVSESTIGAGRSIFITVDDVRASAVLGEMGEGGQIHTSQDLAATIGRSLVDAFAKQGFNISSAEDQNANEILVTLQDLSYSMDNNTLSTGIETKSSMKVVVENKGFIRTYNNSEQRTIPFSANADSNNSQLSNTLGSLVEKVINDQELLAALIK